jgi:hypothetical protein
MTSNANLKFGKHLIAIESLWMNVFQKYATKMPEFKAISDLKVTLPTVKSYEAYIRTLLDKVTSLPEFKLVFDSYHNQFFLHLAPKEWNEYRNINNRLISEFIESKQNLLIQSNTQLTMRDFLELSQYISSPQSLIRLFDLFARHTAYSHWHNDFTSIKVDGGQGKRAPVSKDVESNMLDELSLYHLVKFETMISNKWSVRGLNYRNVISNFLFSNRLKKFDLLEDKELIKAFYKVYLLQGIRNITNSHNSSQVDRTKEDLTELIETSTKRSDLPFIQELTDIGNSFHKKYKDLPMAVYGDSGGSWAKIVAAVHFTKDRAALETALAQDFLDAKKSLGDALAKHPQLIDHLSYLDAKVMMCREFRY